MEDGADVDVEIRVWVDKAVHTILCYLNLSVDVGATWHYSFSVVYLLVDI